MIMKEQALEPSLVEMAPASNAGLHVSGDSIGVVSELNEHPRNLRLDELLMNRRRRRSCKESSNMTRAQMVVLRYE